MRTQEPVPQARRGRPGYDRSGVLRVAVALFNEQGYEATSIADLTSRLGLSKSALYHHFDSKEQLLEVAVDTALGALEAVLERDAARTGAPSDRLVAVIRGAVGVLVEHLPEVTLLLRLRGNSDGERIALERRRRFDHAVTDLVHAAQQQGAFRSDIDGTVATRLIFGMLNSVVEWYRPGGPIDGATLADDVVAIALDGLRTRG